MIWFRQWVLRRVAQFAIDRLVKFPKGERGLLHIRNGMMLCCYDLHDDDSWEYISTLRESVKK